MPAGEWAWKLAVIALAYLIVYFTFGYFIAWRNPVVREYYGGIDVGGFFAHLGTVLGNTFWLIPFQILRAMLWAVLAMPVIRMMRGRWPETALAIGLLFAVVMNAQLLLPNPYMPGSRANDALDRNGLVQFHLWIVGRLATYSTPRVRCRNRTTQGRGLTPACR